MDNNILRLLIIDHSPDNAEQVTQLLRDAGFLLKTQRIHSLAQLDPALKDSCWDAVIADCAVPKLGLTIIAAALKTSGLNAPLLAVANRLDGDDAQRIMDQGARDVFVKGDWGRLIPALTREIKVSANHRENEIIKETLNQLERRYRAIIEGSQEAVCYVHDGMYVDANRAYVTMFGFSNVEQLKGVPLLDAIDKNDRTRFKKFLQNSSATDKPTEFGAIRKDGTNFPVEVAASPLSIGGESCFQIAVSDVSQRKTLEHKIEQLRRRDPLTGLCNKKTFLQELGKLRGSTGNPGGANSLLTLELRQLREINDNIGHAACDRLLLTLARQIQKQTDQGHLLARVGGGQFAILARDLPSDGVAQLRRTYERLAQSFAFTENGARLEVNLALGDAAIEAPMDNAAALLINTFKAALNAFAPPPSTSGAATAPSAIEQTVSEIPVAHTGVVLEIAPAANQAETDAQVPLARPSADTVEPPANLPWQKELERAFTDRKLAMYFQPIINVLGKPREIYEAVLFLESADGELIPASDFMATALACGLASKIDRWIASSAVDTLAQGTRASICVSLSPSAMNDTMLVTALQRHLKATGVNPERLCVQIDASMLSDQGIKAKAFAQLIKKMGARIAIDNFNPTLINESVIRELECDTLKISCVDTADLQKQLSAARSLRTTIIAKEVSDAETLSALWTQHVDYVQGDYLCPPTPEPDYKFESEHELSSDNHAAPNWRISG